MAPFPHPAHRTGQADLSGSSTIAGFRPHRTHRAALPQWALQKGPEAVRFWPPHSHARGLAARVSLCTCCRQYPGAAAGRNLRSTRPAISTFPDMAVGSAYTSSFSRLAPRSLAWRPAHSRCHQFVTANRRLQPLRYLHDCSDCFRLERLPGGIFPHWKAPPLHGARHKQTLRSGDRSNVLAKSNANYGGGRSQSMNSTLSVTYRRGPRKTTTRRPSVT